MGKEIHLASIEKKLVGARCPSCGKSAEGGTCIDNREAVRKPKPDDYAVCLYCGSLNQYTRGLALRKVERTERRRMMRDPRLKELTELTMWLAQEHRKQRQ